MTQRNGRIVRQGNTNPVVSIYNYVTEGTFDAYLWQTLENKQKFISQIMTRKSPVRSCEDVDEQVLSYAEVKTLCAGDERIKEKMDLEVEVTRLRMLKAEYQSAQYRLEDQLLKILPEQIRKKEEILQALDADKRTAEKNPEFAEDTISIEIMGVHYTNRKEAAKALMEAGRSCSRSQTVPIGSYRGFALEGYVNMITTAIQISVKGKMEHPFELSSIHALNLTRLDAVLQKLPEQIDAENEKLSSLIQQKFDAQEQLGTPFLQEEELKEKTKRLEELEAELDIDSGKVVQQEEDQKNQQVNKTEKTVSVRKSRFSILDHNREELEYE